MHLNAGGCRENLATNLATRFSILPIFYTFFLHAVYSCFVKKKSHFFGSLGTLFLKVNIDIVNDRFIVDGCIVL